MIKMRPKKLHKLNYVLTIRCNRDELALFKEKCKKINTNRQSVIRNMIVLFTLGKIKIETKEKENARNSTRINQQ